MGIAARHASRAGLDIRAVLLERAAAGAPDAVAGVDGRAQEGHVARLQDVCVGDRVAASSVVADDIV